MVEIPTATGVVDTADMGYTLMHEHIALRWAPIYISYPELWDRDAILARSVQRLEAAKAAGVRTMVDLTPIDLGRDAPLIAEAAKKAGMNVIVPTGFYHYGRGYFSGRRGAEMTQLMVREITEGIGSTGIRAGVIKAASELVVDATNERFLRAAARAHRATGVPICTHSAPAHGTGLEQQRVFQAEGCDLGRIVIGHSDDSDSIDYLEKIIQNGSFCGMDRIGLPEPRSTVQRADMVAALVERGYADRITLSHDAYCHWDSFPEGVLEERNPDWRFDFIPQEFSAMLRERGVSGEQLTQMSVTNPRRIFEMNQPY